MRITLISAKWFLEYERQNSRQGSPLTLTIRGVHCPVCARSSMTRKLVELCLEARLSSVTTRPPGLFWPPLQHNYHHPWQKCTKCKARPEIKPLNQTKYEIRRNLILTVTCLCSETDWCALRGFYRGGGSWGRGLGWSLGFVKIMWSGLKGKCTGLKDGLMCTERLEICL